MNSLNIANDNALATTEAKETPLALAALATTEANDAAAVDGSVTGLSKWASLSSYWLTETGQTSEMAVALAASIGAGRFALQGNVAQLDLQRKTPMPSSEELTDAKIEAAEARTDTKITRLEGKIDVLATTIVGKIDSLKDDISKLKGDVSKSDQFNHDTRLALVSDNHQTRLVIFGLAFTLAVLAIAVATYGDALFGRGMNVREVVQTVIKEQQEIQKRDTTQPPSSLPNVKQK
jgi:hypothetical protein